MSSLALMFRPKNLDEICGQKAVKAAFLKFIATSKIPHSIFYGPAGCGKTSFARAVASGANYDFYEFDGGNLKIDDFRKILKNYENALNKPLFFIDEIHRLSKTQQEALLIPMENYKALVIGASTENPFFTLSSGIRSRSMLTRIYGTAYADKESLKEHIRIIEEAKKRDHRKLGVEMKLFTFDEEVGGGLPIWLPNGGRLRSKLEQLLYKAHRDRGYEPVRGPELLKADVWRRSGHYANYKENMYFTTIDETEYGIKPMNCVGHIKVYQSDIRSYRDLPLKFFEYGVVHRHEKSGVLHGLFRVREFAQDDSHIFCMPSQIKENILEILKFAGTIMENFGFHYEMEISTKPAKAIGGDEIWDTATKALKEALDENGFKYGIDEGGGAFYGPKIDIKITDALKRKWQCGTIQVDFNLPERFDLGYIDANNERQRPVMLHRALLGSFERFIGILLEHTAGELPFFIAPTQVVIVPISDAHLDYAKEISRELRKINVDSEIASKNESLNKRIRTAEKQRVPMIVVLGDNEVANKSVALRDRQARTQSDMSLAEFINLTKEKLSEVHF